MKMAGVTIDQLVPAFLLTQQIFNISRHQILSTQLGTNQTDITALMEFVFWLREGRRNKQMHYSNA